MRPSGLRRAFAALLVLSTAAGWSDERLPDKLLIAVASNFATPMREIVLALERETGIKPSVSTGSTGKFYAQIRNGAPYDIFLAADDQTPKKLADAGLALRDTTTTYAIGRLALWSTQPAFVDDQGLVLSRLRNERIALANPKLAPYGRAAMAVLASRGLRDKLQNQLVYGENIAQTYQFVATGNADLGFVALSQIRQAPAAAGSAWMVPEQLHPPLRQDAIILNPGKDKQESKVLMSFLKSARAKQIIAAYGYDTEVTP